MNRLKKIVCVVGARPNFIKIAALLPTLRAAGFDTRLIHTGQHYDASMSSIFLNQFNLIPDHQLILQKDNSISQFAQMIAGLGEKIALEQPDLVIVVGDVNSTLAGALVAHKMNIPVAHIEAGLRSFDEDMPEETNRKLTDALSSYLFTTETSAQQNLLQEGIKARHIYFVGNIMIDTLAQYSTKIEQSNILKEHQLNPHPYILFTIHRPSNVDSKDALLRILLMLKSIHKLIKIVFPIHPRTKESLKQFGLGGELERLSNVYLLPPTSYFDFIHLLKAAKGVITDSGGVQEESTYFKIPCLTFRKNTERWSTVEKGSNTLIDDLAPEKVTYYIKKILEGNYKKGQIPPLWDGQTASRITTILKEQFLHPPISN